jgi:hypothetical protein
MRIKSLTKARELKAQLSEELADASLEVHSVGILNRASGFQLSVVCGDINTARKVSRIAHALCPDKVDIEVATRRQLSHSPK